MCWTFAQPNSLIYDLKLILMIYEVYTLPNTYWFCLQNYLKSKKKAPLGGASKINSCCLIYLPRMYNHYACRLKQLRKFHFPVLKNQLFFGCISLFPVLFR